MIHRPQVAKAMREPTLLDQIAKGDERIGEGWRWT
jgi:hypothetical protein